VLTEKVKIALKVATDRPAIIIGMVIGYAPGIVVHIPLIADIDPVNPVIRVPINVFINKTREMKL